MNLSPPFDLQIAGVRDNGSAHGIVDVNQKSGPLILVPWRESNYITSGSYVVGTAGGGDNGDGSSAYIQFQTPITLPGVANYIRHKFYGTSYGIRFDPNFTSGGGDRYDFCVIIDRVAYRVSKRLILEESLTDWDSNQANSMHSVIVATDLPDTVHDAEINITAQAGINGQRIFGFMADAKRYRQYPPKAFPASPTALTTSLVTVTLGTVARFRGLGMRAIVYANVDSVARVVTVQYNGATCWVKTIAASDSAIFDPGTLLGINSLADVGAGEYKHKVDLITTTAVQATVIVGE